MACMHTEETSPAAQALLDHAGRFPEATLEFPWGHAAMKVRGKIFVTVAVLDGILRVSAKLPDSAQEAVLLPFAQPSGYGLGRHGWVTAEFPPDTDPPLPVLRGWIDESYRAVAPAALLEGLEIPGPRRRKA